MASKAELWVKYHLNPPTGRQPLEVVKSDATTVVIPYDKWIRNKCKCCGRGGASGLWRCHFTGYVADYFLCAACGLRNAYAKWNGFFSPKLERVDLIITFTFPSRVEVAKE